MAAARHARVTWSGDLTSGSGTIEDVGSGAFSKLPVSWAARTESSDGKTSPEELLAAAHASCFAMALSNGLAKAGTPAERLSVEATVTFDKVDGGWRVASSALSVRGKVPGAKAEDFQTAAGAARDGCPISQALKDNVKLSVEASLES
ncbi:MAG TPA: OsmC family peroxiredoxin [Candidatus Limnocylindrales bacterium]|nr:OsmC family peroxiredoxin [Candidatus Limnocylindrales bacterium]